MYKSSVFLACFIALNSVYSNFGFTQNSLEWLSENETEEYNQIIKVKEHFIVAGGNYNCDNAKLYSFDSEKLIHTFPILVDGYNFTTQLVGINENEFIVTCKVWIGDDLPTKKDLICRYNCNGELLDSVVLDNYFNSYTRSYFYKNKYNNYVFGSGSNLYIFDRDLNILDIINNANFSDIVALYDYERGMIVCTSNGIYKTASGAVVKMSENSGSTFVFDSINSKLYFVEANEFFKLDVESFKEEKIPLTMRVNELHILHDSLLLLGISDSYDATIELYNTDFKFLNKITGRAKCSYGCGVFDSGELYVVGDELGLMDRPFIKKLNQLAFTYASDNDVAIGVRNYNLKILDSLKTPGGWLYEMDLEVFYTLTNKVNHNIGQAKIISEPLDGYNCSIVRFEKLEKNLGPLEHRVGRFYMNLGFREVGSTIMLEAFSLDHFFDHNADDNVTTVRLVTKTDQYPPSSIFYSFEDHSINSGQQWFGAKYEIFSVMHEHIGHGYIRDSKTDIPVFPAGVYFIQLSFNDQKEIIKVVIPN